MNDQMFHAVAEHERAVRAYVDSTLTGIPTEMGDDESSWMERPLLQQPVGSIVISTPSIHYPLAALTGGCVDDTCNPLMIEQPMEFITHDSVLEVMQEASQVEPIPYYRGPAMHPPPQPLQGYWSNNASRHGVSALAVDWDALEFGEEELEGSGGIETPPSMHHPARDEPDEEMYQV